MPVVVLELPSGRTEQTDAPNGGRLLDLCDQERAALPFSCRSASCGTCRVEVLEGMNLLLPPHDDESEVLRAFGDDPQQRRLACQVRLRAGNGRLRVRPVDD